MCLNTRSVEYTIPASTRTNRCLPAQRGVRFGAWLRDIYISPSLTLTRTRTLTRRRMYAHRREDGGFELTVRAASSRPSPVHFVRGGTQCYAAIIPGDGVAEQVITTGLNQFLSLYNAALIGRLVLTWFPNPPQFIVGPLSTICDPYLNLFRGIIPPLGGTIDLSPILAFVALDLFTNSAAALPCELSQQDKPWKPTKN